MIKCLSKNKILIKQIKLINKKIKKKSMKEKIFLVKMNKLISATAALLISVNADTHMSSKIQPGPFVNETWYSGLVDIDSTDDIFYWWFESRNDPSTDPLVLWLTGGPGCASEVALFFENGPYKFGNDKKTLNGNAFSWSNKANLLYVD